MNVDVERIDIPAREARGALVSAGQRFRVIDPEGGQVGDLFAFNARDISEYASAEHTRVFHSRLFPPLGEVFVTNRRRPILRYLEDTSPGIHDMLMAACDPTRYHLLGVEGWHASCQENLQHVMASFGHDHIETPQPINLFMNTPPRADGTIEHLPSPTAPGDSVLLRAEMDAIVVVSACPQDLTVINRGGPKPLVLEVLS